MRELEAQLKAAQQAAVDASRAKSAFLASMSHELRTPLNAVLGFTQLMERERSRSAEDRESLAIIRRSGEHLLELINEVLSLARIDSGKAALVDAPFDLHRLLLAVRDMIRQRAESKGLGVGFDLAPEVPVSVRGDEGKLRQVLVNLMANSVKFTERGAVTLVVSRREERIRFEVRDTGEGISKAEVATLFAAFSQTASGRKTGEGSGLGLAISRGLVQLMGGDIEVTSEAGKGSTFAFELALRGSSASAGAGGGRRVTRLEPGQDPPRILVVDDIADNRLFLSRLLSSVGFPVWEAGDGTRAAALVKEVRPRLVFLDVRMPGLDGRETVLLIREGERGSAHRCAIVGMSAGLLEEERRAFLQAGADSFLGKPSGEEAVFDTLQRLLGVRFEHDAAGAEPAATLAPEERLTAERLTVLPPEVLQELRAALAGGDVEAARAVAESARTRSPRVVKSVAAMLERLEVGKLLSIVEESLERRPGTS